MPAPFEVSTETVEGDIVVIAVQGELDLNTAPELEAALGAVPAIKGARLLINLSNCEFIDSTGLALIVQAWQRIDAGPDGDGAGRMVLCCPNQQVRRVLEVTGIDNSIGLHDDFDAAADALRSPATAS